MALVRGCPTLGDDAEICELSRIFWFVKNNIEYRQDPYHYDLYATAKRTLQVRGGDCFSLDTPVIVKSKASQCYQIVTLGELEHTWPAYDALSYDFTNTKWVFKPILGWQNRGVREVYESHLFNGPSFRHTLDHRVWFWDGQQAKHRKYDERPLESFLEDDRNWHTRVLVASKIPALGTVDYPQDKAYLTGIYAAEGFADDHHVRIAQDKPEIRDRIEKALAAYGAPFSTSLRTRHAYYSLMKSGLKDLLRYQGTNSFDMHFDASLFGASEDSIRTALEAHGDGDAYRPKPDASLYKKVKAIHATSSESLVRELQLMCMILGEPWYSQLQLHHGGAGSSPIWRFHRWLDTTRVGKRVIDSLPGLAYSPIRQMEPAGDEPVADITVEDTHNFVLGNGMLVHNCDDHCILTGAYISTIGYQAGAKIISPNGSDWHIYAVAGVFPRSTPTKILTLDTTQPDAFPGWEPPRGFHTHSKLVTFSEAGPIITGA